MPLNAKIAVLGWGQFGQAIGSLLEYNKVSFVTADIDKPLTQPVDILFQMVPTQFIRDAFRTNAKFITPDTIIVNGAKGIEKSTHKLPYQIIENIGPHSEYFSLIGPSFASGIIAKDPTLVSLGYAMDKHLDAIKDLVQTPYFRIQSTTNYHSLELAAAMKNVYAILCGYAEGLGYGINTRAKLITMAFKEIIELDKTMGNIDSDPTAPGIIGDLVLTCSSPESRNYQFGIDIATKDRRELKKIEETVEGFYTSFSIQALATEHSVKLPLADLAHQLISSGAGGKHHFHEFVESL